MTAARPLAALTLFAVATVATVAAQVPPPDAPPGPPPVARVPARRVLTERIGDGQLIEADEKHLVLRIPVDPSRPAGDTRDEHIDLADGEDLRIAIDVEPAKVADLKLPIAASVTRFRGTGRPLPAMQSHVSVTARTPSVVGTLTAVTPPTLTMTTGPDRTPLTVTTDENTRVLVFAPVAGRPGVRPGKPGTLADLRPGMNLDVHPPTGVATFISATVIPTPDELAAATRPLGDERESGVLEKIDGNAMTFWARTGRLGKKTIDVEGAAVKIDGRDATLAELQPDMDVTVSRQAGRPPRGVPALRIWAKSPPVEGYIKSLDGNTLTIWWVHRLLPTSEFAVTLDDTVTVEVVGGEPFRTKPGTRDDLVIGRVAGFVSHDGKLTTVRVAIDTPATQPATRPAARP